MEVIAAVNTRCTSCRLSEDRITNGQLSCFSQQTAIFRAEIHGTADTTSLQLRDEIGGFAGSGASIQVLGVTMTFVTECGVAVNSFNEQRCSMGSSQLPLVPIIVGVALGGVIVLMLCGILVICLMVCRRRGMKKKVTLRRRAR